MTDASEAEFREIEHREHEGKPAIVAIAVRHYPTTVDDLWAAITTAERLQRWFLPIEGELRLGGRYQLQGNAGGTITRCDPPHALDVTWEFMGGTSWVNLRLTAEGEGTRLRLEHIAHEGGIGEEHLKTYGPGAVGIGWDLGLRGLRQHVDDPAAKLDPAAAEAWTQSDEGRAYIRTCGEGWAAADIAAGEDSEDARARAERTIAFYTGG